MLDPLLLTKKQAADVLTISVRQLDRCRVEGGLPTVYLGPRTLRFRPEDLVAFRDAKVSIEPAQEWPSMTVPRGRR